MQFTSRIEKWDLLRVFVAHYLVRRPLVWGVPLVTSAATAWLDYHYMQCLGGSLVKFVVVALGMYVGIVLLATAHRGWMIWRLYGGRSLLEEDVSVGPGGIVFRTGDDELRLSWTSISSLRVTEAYVILRRGGLGNDILVRRRDAPDDVVAAMQRFHAEAHAG